MWKAIRAAQEVLLSIEIKALLCALNRGLQGDGWGTVSLILQSAGYQSAELSLILLDSKSS